ncbi:hypothetical protein M0R04_14875 [Candidatus Dojkabacteria bacterium]|jgi:hypothetical protein|nr:hypothetical protein [Candidatus Dojkabacteria bacterium]
MSSLFDKEDEILFGLGNEKAAVSCERCLEKIMTPNPVDYEQLNRDSSWYDDLFNDDNWDE